jgi:transcriptional regulator with XRE-family HTH domain
MPPLSRRQRALGDALCAFRKARGLTQETLGDRSSLTTNYVGDAERGERNVSVRALGRGCLAGMYDVQAGPALSLCYGRVASVQTTSTR